VAILDLKPSRHDFEYLLVKEREHATRIQKKGYIARCCNLSFFARSIAVFRANGIRSSGRTR
jgi:hypothetical protein